MRPPGLIDLALITDHNGTPTAYGAGLRKHPAAD
ncbi:hypothetical protein BJ998_007308 [Kutzneria kofuensis]|uniref:Uncharacterized protein n=1 Tax=Kutzneria kofuensis TaxID=103725 RepID=A0A7W9KP86_9PSEU|nr:hypothetical protein [Kutzneria kofuensis]